MNDISGTAWGLDDFHSNIQKEKLNLKNLGFHIMIKNL